jgi:hypothetical protein
VVERLAAVARGGDEDLQLLTDLALTDVLGEPPGPQRALDRFFVRRCGSVEVRRVLAVI